MNIKRQTDMTWFKLQNGTKTWHAFIESFIRLLGLNLQQHAYCINALLLFKQLLLFFKGEFLKYFRWIQVTSDGRQSQFRCAKQHVSIDFRKTFILYENTSSSVYVNGLGTRSFSAHWKARSRFSTVHVRVFKFSVHISWFHGFLYLQNTIVEWGTFLLNL